MVELNISKQTEDKVKLAKKFIEDKYKSILTEEMRNKQQWKKITFLMNKNNIPLIDQQRFSEKVKNQQQIKKRLERQKDSLQNYELYQLIGKGAFGDVRLAKNKVTNDVVAIKRMSKKRLAQKKQLSSAYLQREFMIKNNNSKYLVNLHSTFQDRKYLYIVMQYVPGGDLLHLLIEKDIFTEEQTKFYIAEMIMALQQIHSKHFIHRDIKPDNILIDKDGHIKISDFGLSKHIQIQDSKCTQTLTVNRLRNKKQDVSKSTSKLNKVHIVRQRQIRKFSKVGTPDYISPDVLICDQYDYSIDIWSVGVIMFECLFGYPPFSDQDSKSVCSKVINWIQYLTFPDDIEVSLEAKLLILSLMNERSKRISIPQIKKHPFFENLNWNQLRNYKPPMIPVIENQLDTRNFQEFEQKQSDSWLKVDDQSEQNQHTFEKDQNPIQRQKSNSLDYSFAGFQYKRIGYDVFQQVERQIKKYNRNSHKVLVSSSNQQNKKLIKSPKHHKNIQRFYTEQNQSKPFKNIRNLNIRRARTPKKNRTPLGFEKQCFLNSNIRTAMGNQKKNQKVKIKKVNQFNSKFYKNISKMAIQKGI